MPLREFVDADGMRWKVWDVSAAQVHPRLKEENFYAGYDLGWLTFEAEGGEIRRRLCPCPANWEDSSPEELERLWREAEPVAPRRKRADAGPEDATATAEDEAIALMSVAERERREEPPESRRTDLRTFQYPGGRVWTVGTLTINVGGERRPVLRFISGSHKVDVEHWPDDWQRLSDDQLAELLRSGAPARVERPNYTGFRRRRDDVQP